MKNLSLLSLASVIAIVLATAGCCCMKKKCVTPCSPCATPVTSYVQPAQPCDMNGGTIREIPTEYNENLEFESADDFEEAFNK